MDFSNRPPDRNGHSKIEKVKKKLKGLLKFGDEIPKFGNPDDLIIPVMGATATGKSTFINALLGKQEAKVGHTFDTGTRTLQQFWLEIPDNFQELRHRRLVVVDTPGFDDLNLTDQEILRQISAWLAYAYIKGMKIAGIIYLYDISQPRPHPSTMRNTEIFRCLCGEDALSGVVLVTTKWGLLVREEDGGTGQMAGTLGCGWQRARRADSGSRQKARIASEADQPHGYNGNAREKLYCDGLWKDLILAGSAVRRFEDTRDSASDIINEILRKFQNTHNVDTLQIQAELVDLLCHIPETSAGKALRLKLSGLYELQKKRSTTVNPSTEEKQRIEDLIKQVKDLNIPVSRRILVFFGFSAPQTQFL